MEVGVERRINDFRFKCETRGDAELTQWTDQVVGDKRMSEPV